jgi:hypothetical protein
MTKKGNVYTWPLIPLLQFSSPIYGCWRQFFSAKDTPITIKGALPPAWSSMNHKGGQSQVPEGMMSAIDLPLCQDRHVFLPTSIASFKVHPHF